MKKNFLLLLLLTLLPLAGWAQTAVWSGGTPEIKYGEALSGLAPQATVVSGYGNHECINVGEGDTYPSGDVNQFHWQIRKGTTVYSSSATLDVGEYTLRLLVRHQNGVSYGYPTYANNERTLTFKVVKGEVTVTGLDVTKVWDNGVTDPTIADFGTNASWRSVSGINGTDDEKWDLVKGYLAFQRVDNGTDVGTYKYTFTATGAPTNFDLKFVGGNLNVTQATNAVPTVTIATDWTYGDDPTSKITVENSVTPKGYGAETATFEFFDETGATSLGATVPTDAGKYQVKVTIPETVNYTEVSTVKIPFEIKKATLTDADLAGKWSAYFTVPVANPADLKFKGTETENHNALLDPAAGVTAAGATVFAHATTAGATADIKYRVTKTGYDSGWQDLYTVAAAGDYTVQYQIINAKNFNDFTSPTKITKSVAKAKPTIAEGAVKTDLTYTASALGLIATAPTATGVGGAAVTGNVTYSSTDAGFSGVAQADAKATNAGDYEVTYTFTPTGAENIANYESVTGVVGGTGAKAHIEKAELPITAPTLEQPLVYTGGAQGLLKADATATFAGSPVDIAVTYTWNDGTADKSATAYGDVKATNAGSYVITYAAVPNGADKANFKTPATATVTATIAPAPLDIAAQPIEVDWTGKAIDLEAAHYAKGDPTDFVGPEASDVDMQYAIVNSLVQLKSIEGATTEKPIPTDAGYYKFELAKAVPDPTPCNYVINTFSPEGSLQINKIASTSATITVPTLTYNGGQQALLTIPDPSDVKGGTMKYYLAASATEAAPAKDSGKWVDAIPQGQDAGKYYVYSYVKGDNNHNDVEPAAASTEVVIKAKDLKDAFFTLGPTTLAYTGADQTASVTITAKDTELDAALTDADYTVTKPAKMIDATEYTFTFTGKGNYQGSATAKIAIAQKTLAASMFTLSDGVIYTGKPQKPTITAADGEPSVLKAADWDYEIKNSKGTVVAIDAMVNADTYTFRFFAKAGGNYMDAAKPITIDWTIAPANPAIEPTVALTVVYNGEEQELAEAATSNDGEFTYAAVAKGAAEPEASAYKAAVPKALNAGQYDVYTKFTPDANHNAATVGKVTATIEKKNIGIMLNTLDESIEANIITYNGEAVPMNAKLWTIYAPSDLPGVDANLPVNDRPFSFTFPAEVKNAGDYEFTELTPVWKDEKVQNYTFTFSQAAKFTVHPKKLDKAMITLDPAAGAYVQGKKYTVAVTVADGDPSILVFGDKDAAKNDVNYVIKNGDATVANGSIEAAGTYNFVFTAQNNYEGEVTVPFVVGTKSIVDLLQPANWDDVVYNGKSQAPTIVLNDKKNDGKVYTLGTSDYELKITYPAPTAQNPGNLAVVTAADVKDARTYTFTITGKGNYSGTISKTKTITRKPLRDDEKQKDFSMPASAEYIALGQMPAITAKSEVEALVEGKDYEVWVDGAKIDTKKDKLNEAKAYAFEFKGIGNYTGSVTRTFTITKATVIVTASSYTKKYNGKNGVEGAKVVGGGDAWTYSGLKNYDGFDPALVQAAEGALTVKPVNNQTKDVGTYQLVVDPSKFSYGVEPGVNNYNFIVADEQGTLTIEKTPIVLGFDTEKKDNSGNTVPVFITKEYGVKDADFFSKNNQFVEKFVKVKAAEDDSPIAAELAGLAYEIKNAQGKVIRPAGLTFSRDNADVEAVGKYTGVVTMTADGGVFSNYDVAIHSTKGNFEIAKAVLTIALKDDIEVIYDGAVPTEEVASISNDKLAVSGKQWNDDYSVIKNVKGTIVNPSEHVGSYVVKLEAEAENYTVVTLDARIIIREAPLTVTIADQTINKTPVKDVNNMLKTSKAATVKGIVGNDDIKATMVVADNVNTQTPGAYNPGVKFTIANTDYKLVDAKGNKLDAVYGKLIVLDNGYEIALNDAATYNQAKKETHDVTFTTRSVNQDTWNVCVLPFETTPAEVSDMFGYAVVDLLNKDANDGNIHFVVTTSGVIPAGTPFVFKPTKDAAGAVTDFDQVRFEDVEVLPLADFATKELFVEGGNTYAKDAANNKFWGTFKETTFEGKKFWYMSKGDWKDASQRSVTLKSYRAYVEFDEANVAAGARIFVEEADGTITAIKGIDANGQLIAADGWYTVNGVKLNAAPTQKGTYIKDGKKVFVK